MVFLKLYMEKTLSLTAETGSEPLELSNDFWARRALDKYGDIHRFSPD